MAPSVARPVTPESRGGDGPVRPLLLRLLVATVALAGAYLAGPRLGLAFSPRILIVLLLGAAAVQVWPARAYQFATLSGVLVMTQWTSMRYLVYHLLLVSGAFALRHSPRLLAPFLLVTVLVIPKEFFRLFYNWEFLHDWLNPFLLAHFLLIVWYWWQWRKRPGNQEEPGFWAWSALFLFPNQPMNPIAFSPGDLWRRGEQATVGQLEIARSLGLVLVKAAVVIGVAWLWPRGRLMDMGADEVMALSFWRLWAAVGLSYLHVALTLSGAADVAVLIARVFGWNLPHHFRFALLAWNPVELWRRWAIYNRRLLLTLVYFPLGGGARHRMLNVMLTFLASGFLLHSGWVGSKYWELGEGGWRDQTVYFLLQGLAVCACLGLWKITGKDPAADRKLRWSPGRVAATVGTQALSAWLHILVVAPAVAWGDRWRLMGRCLALLGW